MDEFRTLNILIKDIKPNTLETIHELEEVIENGKQEEVANNEDENDEDENSDEPDNEAEEEEQ